MFDYNAIFGSVRGVITFMATAVLVKYYLYLVLAPFYKVKHEIWKMKLRKCIKKGLINGKYHPKVSIVIPAWNEEVGIVTTIKSALNNTYNIIEVVVVNDGSSDQTEKRVLDFIKVYKRKSLRGKTVVYKYQENSGKGAALNTGIRISTGEIVVTMDADSAHDRDAVKNIVAYFQDPSVDALVGNVKVANNFTIVGILQRLEYLFGFYFKRVHSLFNAEYIYGGACAAFRRSTTFNQIGLFDIQNKTEDIEYSMRTKLHGLKSVYAEDVIVYTEGASDWKGLYKQRVRWKKGRMDTFIKYRRLFFSTHRSHSKFLSWVVLPYAVFGEIQMLFEPMFFALIWAYTIVSGDFLSIGLSSLFILFTFVAACLFGDNRTNRLFVFTFPVFWILFYAITAVEFLALVKSLDLALSNKDVVWQKWARKGISGKEQLA